MTKINTQVNHDNASPEFVASLPEPVSRKDIEQYIRIEVSDKKHIIASRLIGVEDRFQQVAVVTARTQAEKLVKLLNAGEKI